MPSPIREGPPRSSTVREVEVRVSSRDASAQPKRDPESPAHRLTRIVRVAAEHLAQLRALVSGWRRARSSSEIQRESVLRPTLGPSPGPNSLGGRATAQSSRKVALRPKCRRGVSARPATRLPVLPRYAHGPSRRPLRQQKPRLSGAFALG